MTLYVLDTDIATHFWHGHPLVCQRVGQCQPSEVAITVMTVEEQLTGWYTHARQAKKPAQVERAYRGLAETVRFLAQWPILLYTAAALARYAPLVAMKLQIGKTDLRIAAITLEHGGILVTRNVRDFQRIPGLVIEDWSV